ncbi:DUF2093 domain-containing protein [Bartonella bacilliformis]|uniref:DUF2093 domain-containing protein n=1 Tax=Bartonella bacilliformis Ver097 TaxID=1293911 RepID=A0A072R7D1_BARBA|nr:DUF2093 domain-containing protein [Bartonella bacilliformis]KEG21102.1 hypothetical protein H710_00049 [Bartonella bacilliformis Ver097]
MFSSDEREAIIHYSSGGYEIVKYGTYTLCAVSGQKIPIDDLKYWNHERQEAYACCEFSYQRELECNSYLRQLLNMKK